VQKILPNHIIICERQGDENVAAGYIQYPFQEAVVDTRHAAD